jgi:hypothetical protein
LGCAKDHPADTYQLLNLNTNRLGLSQDVVWEAFVAPNHHAPSKPTNKEHTFDIDLFDAFFDQTANPPQLAVVPVPHIAMPPVIPPMPMPAPLIIIPPVDPIANQNQPLQQGGE